MSVSFKSSKGRTAKDIVKQSDLFEQNRQFQQQQQQQQPGGMKRKATSAISESINRQNLQTINRPSGPQQQQQLSGDSLPFPTNTHALLNTAEGQEEFAKLVAQTTKQKELNKALRARRKEFEIFLLQTQQEKIKEDSSKLERKKRKLQQKTLQSTYNSAANRQIINQLQSHQNANVEQQQQHQ
jgi:hypothetical protein